MGLKFVDNGTHTGSTTGKIDLSTSSPGTYDISYTAADNDGNGTPDKIIHLNSFDQTNAQLGHSSGTNFGTSVAISADGNLVFVGEPNYDNPFVNGYEHGRVVGSDGIHKTIIGILVFNKKWRCDFFPFWFFSCHQF